MVHLWIGCNLQWEPKRPIRTKSVLVFVSSKIDCSYFSRTLHHYARVGRLLLGSVQTGQANLLGQTPPVEHYLLLFRESVPHIWHVRFFLADILSKIKFSKIKSELKTLRGPPAGAKEEVGCSGQVGLQVMVQLAVSRWSTTHITTQIIPFHPPAWNDSPTFFLSIKSYILDSNGRRGL